MIDSTSKKHSVAIVSVISAVSLVVMWMCLRSGTDSNTLIVYCSHDRVFAESILENFSRQTGIQIQARYDTEATKSLGLINQIVQESAQPRCDVFWNNELLGIVELQEQGLLEAYRGSGWERIPDQYRDPAGYWVGFAARMRVSIINTERGGASEDTLQNLFELEPSRLAMAKPLFGTTLTHYTVLWQLWGSDRLKFWHRDLRLRGMREVDGNAAVKDIVALGTCDAGLTDTDDFFIALDDGLPVQMQAVRVSDFDATRVPDDPARVAPTRQPGRISASHTICIPNTVAIVKGSRRLAAARCLVDFLTSAETELALARSKSRQIPLGPVDETQLPQDVRQLSEWARDGFDLRPLLPARRKCLDWLKSEYLK